MTLVPTIFQSFYRLISGDDLNAAFMNINAAFQSGSGFGATAGIVAAPAGTQAAATPLTAALNSVDTVGAAGASVMLPAAVAGTEIFVANTTGTNALAVFPQSGASMNGTVNGSLSIAATKQSYFVCVANGLWRGQAAS